MRSKRRVTHRSDVARDTGRACLPPSKRFFGWRVVYGAFTVAFFSWGMGFYGPPIYLQALHESRGWPIPLISAAITVHYLSGSICITRLPWMYNRFSLPVVTAIGLAAMIAGCFGWATAPNPVVLFAATLLTGFGWAVMGGAAVNAIVSPWFVRLRPKALSFAYNGASVGGLVFSALWVFLIRTLGFPAAVIVVGAVAVIAVGYFAAFVFPRSPAQLGQSVDGDAPTGHAASFAPQRRLPGTALWRDLKFVTLAIGMSLGLFAQIGLFAQAFSIAVPIMGAQHAGLLLSATALTAVLGRSVTGWALPDTMDRRLVSVANYGLQAVGGILLVLSAGQSAPFVVVGMLLFGWGVGNANLLPPLIAQAEFAREDLPRVVALITAVSQAVYAFAPGLFGLIRSLASPTGVLTSEAAAIGVAAAMIQVLACGAFLMGRPARRPAPLICGPERRPTGS
jgi:MFS family permease